MHKNHYPRSVAALFHAFSTLPRSSFRWIGVQNARTPPFGAWLSRLVALGMGRPKSRRVVHRIDCRFRFRIPATSRHRGFRGRWLPWTLGQHSRGYVCWYGQRGPDHRLHCFGLELRARNPGERSCLAGRIQRRHRHPGRYDPGDPRLAALIGTIT